MRRLQTIAELAEVARRATPEFAVAADCRARPRELTILHLVRLACTEHQPIRCQKYIAHAAEPPYRGHTDLLVERRIENEGELDSE